MSAAEATQEQPVEPVIDDTTTVPIPEQADADDASAEPQPGAPGARDDKKRSRGGERYGELRQEVERRARESEELRSEMARMREEQAEMRGRIMAQAQPANQAEDPIARLTDEANSALSNAAGGQDPDRHMKRYHEIQHEIARHIARSEYQAMARNAPQPQPQQYATRAVLEAEFGWLPENEEARAYAGVIYRQLLEQGRPDSIPTMWEALSKTAATFSLGTPRQASNDNARGRYVGVPTRDSGASRGGIDAVKMDEGTKKLAEAYWPDVKPKEAYSRMAALLAGSEKKDD